MLLLKNIYLSSFLYSMSLHILKNKHGAIYVKPKAMSVNGYYSKASCSGFNGNFRISLISRITVNPVKRRMPYLSVIGCCC